MNLTLNFKFKTTILYAKFIRICLYEIVIGLNIPSWAQFAPFRYWANGIEKEQKWAHWEIACSLLRNRSSRQKKPQSCACFAPQISPFDFLCSITFLLFISFFFSKTIKQTPFCFQYA